MSEKIKRKIIILRTIKHGESDLVVHGLTTTGARLNLIGKGALKSRKRFGGGVLEPSHYVEIFYKPSRFSGDESLHFLEEAQLINGFEGIRSNYDRLQTAFYFLQLVSKVAQEEDESSKDLFDLLGNALTALETSDSIGVLKVHFELKLLSSQGVLPQDLPETDLLMLPIKDHSKTQLKDLSDLAPLRNRVHYAIQQYLGR